MGVLSTSILQGRHVDVLGGEVMVKLVDAVHTPKPDDVAKGNSVQTLVTNLIKVLVGIGKGRVEVPWGEIACADAGVKLQKSN